MPVHLTLDGITWLLKPGMRVFLSGLASESSAFREALQTNPHTADGVTFCGAMAPGINVFDYASLHPTARVETLFMAPPNRESAAAGKVDHLPIGYHAAFGQFSKTIFDLAVLHVAPPDASGMCSFGVTSDFQEAALNNTRTILAIVNPLMPTTNGPAIRYDDIDFISEQAVPISAFPVDLAGDRISERIARHVAGLIRDGDCLQFGLGRIPNLVISSLTDRRRLTIHSGLVTDAVISLLGAGSIASQNRGCRSPIITNAFVGTAKLYEQGGRDDVAFASVGFTHALTTLARIPNLVSINSAIEIDLFGQVNSETIGHRSVSGIGGALDFIRGANALPGGRPIVAVPICHNQRRLTPGCFPEVPRASDDTSRRRNYRRHGKWYCGSAKPVCKSTSGIAYRDRKSFTSGSSGERILRREKLMPDVQRRIRAPRRQPAAPLICL